MILNLNIFIKDQLEKVGFKSNVLPATHNFNEETLISDGSHRHVAVIAGLGIFGLNNMLIIKKEDAYV
jgi:epoxyqueuosine reductase QueG